MKVISRPLRAAGPGLVTGLRPSASKAVFVPSSVRVLKESVSLGVKIQVAE